MILSAGACQVTVLLDELEVEIGAHLPKVERQRWPGRVASAKALGLCDRTVWARWIVWLLGEEVRGSRAEWPGPESSVPFCDVVIGLYARQLRRDYPSSEEWESVAEGAWLAKDLAKEQQGMHPGGSEGWVLLTLTELECEVSAAAAEAAAQQSYEDEGPVGEQTWAPTVAWAAAEVSGVIAPDVTRARSGIEIEAAMDAAREASYIRQANALLRLLRSAVD